MTGIRIKRLICCALLSLMSLGPNVGLSEGASSSAPCIRKILSAFGVYSMDISPSGTKLAVLYQGTALSVMELAITDMASGKTEKFSLSQLDPEAKKRAIGEISIRWGQDDNHLLYLGMQSGQIKQLDLQAKTVTWIADCPQCESFATHVNGFTAIQRKTTRTRQTGMNQLEVSSPYGELPRKVTVDNLPGGDMTFSRDGRKVAYLFLDRQPNAVSKYVIQGIDLYTREVFTTPFRGHYPPVWMSDTSILGADPKSLTLWQYDVVSHTQSLFASFVTGDPNDKWIPGTVHRPGGRNLAFYTEGAGLKVYSADLACKE